jgi:hypothetical protein
LVQTDFNSGSVRVKNVQVYRQTDDEQSEKFSSGLSSNELNKDSIYKQTLPLATQEIIVSSSPSAGIWLAIQILM